MWLFLISCTTNTPQEQPIQNIKKPKQTVVQESVSPPKPKKILAPMLNIEATRASFDPADLWPEELLDSQEIRIATTGSIEHFENNTYVAFPYSSGYVPKLKEDDRLWTGVRTSQDANLYVIAVQYKFGTVVYEKWLATTMSSKEELMLFPDGLILSEEQAYLGELLIIASKTPIDWLNSFQMQNCSGENRELEFCKNINALSQHAPIQAKCGACYPSSKGTINTGEKELTAAFSLNSGDDFTFGLFEFKPVVNLK